MRHGGPCGAMRCTVRQQQFNFAGSGVQGFALLCSLCAGRKSLYRWALPPCHNRFGADPSGSAQVGRRLADVPYRRLIGSDGELLTFSKLPSVLHQAPNQISHVRTRCLSTSDLDDGVAAAGPCIHHTGIYISTGRSPAASARTISRS
jgi:hypothetical protein